MNQDAEVIGSRHQTRPHRSLLVQSYISICCHIKIFRNVWMLNSSSGQSTRVGVNSLGFRGQDIMNVIAVDKLWEY